MDTSKNVYLIPLRYGIEEIPHDITKQEILTYYSFNEDEKTFINTKCRLYPSRISLGIQIGTYRFIGRPQYMPEKAPSDVINFVARELQIEGNFIPLEYADRLKTRQEHIQIAREFLGLSNFPVNMHQELIDRLIQVSPDLGNIHDWLKGAEDYLRDKKFVLPSVKVLNRIVFSARYKSLENMMSQIISQLSNEQIDNMEKLLNKEFEDDIGWDDLLNKNIYKANPAKLKEALRRIKTIRDLQFNITSIPEEHIRYLSQQGIRLDSNQLKKSKSLKRYSTMAITLLSMESELSDIVIQMNDEIMSNVFRRGQKRYETYFRKHKQTLQRVFAAFTCMSDAVLDDTKTPAEKIDNIETTVSLDTLRSLREETARIQIPRGLEKLHFASEGYQNIQKYLPDLLETFKITSSSKNDPILEAAEYYSERRKSGKPGIGIDAPTDFIQETNWERIVFDSNGKPKTKPWIVCLADKLRKSFRQGSLEIEGARQYKSLNSDLIPWSEWHAMEKEEDETLPFTAVAEKAIVPIFCSIQTLSGNYKHWTESNSANIDDENRIHLTKLDKIEEPASVGELRKIIQGRMPNRALSEIMVEVDALVGYSSNFTRLSTGWPINLKDKSNRQALYAILLSSACNIPLYKVSTKPEIPSDFLETIREDTIRPQTLYAAIAGMVDFYSRLPLAKVWGLGETSSSDGQGFLAHGHPLGALYNRKRLGRRPGFIIYTHIADNYAPFYTQVIPAVVREAPYVLDGLMYHGTSLMPREHYTDSHGYTEIVFAMTYLLGFKLAPRLANIPDLTLWYGKGYDVSCPELFDGGIDIKSIASQWEAIQRIMDTIFLGRAKASQIIRKISSFSRKHPLFKAFHNLGRLVRTSHILEIAGDKDYRRRILQGLNKGESRNALVSDIRYARKGNIREKDPEMQLCTASALNLTALCVATWNTIHMQRVIRKLIREGYDVKEEDLQFFSPFAHRHINFYGDFRFGSVPDTNLLVVEKDFQPLFIKK